MKGMFLIAGVLAGLCLFVVPATGEPGKATDSVRAMLDEVVAIQNDPSLLAERTKATRRDLIRKVILKNFDFGEMAMGSLGPEQWNALTNTQRSEFKSIFQDLFLDSYSRLVLDFLKKEKIEYRSEETVKGKVIVRTAIQRLEDRIPVDYLMGDTRSGRLVCDVIIDGVSIVQNYRKSFLRVIKQESFASLLKKMRMQQKASVGETRRGS